MPGKVTWEVEEEEPTRYYLISSKTTTLKDIIGCASMTEHLSSMCKTRLFHLYCCKDQHFGVLLELYYLEHFTEDLQPGGGGACL